MTAIAVTKDSFEEVVAANDIVLVDFWAAWCGPCRKFAPVFEEASERHPGAVFAKVDTEAEQELAARFGIMSIPTLMVFRDQVLLYSQAGALPAASLEDLLTQVEALDMDQVRREIAAREQEEPAAASAATRS
jgi:thioredoxin 1